MKNRFSRKISARTVAASTMYFLIILLFFAPDRGLQASPLNDRDLAILIPKENVNDYPAFTLGNKKGILDKKHYLQMKDGFLGTEGESGLAENSASDWFLVSARVEPCSPLFPNLATKDELCWPEVRLVFQPILQQKILYQARYIEYFAEDRGAHALYHVPYSGGSAGEQAKVEDFIATIKENGSLSPEEKLQFIKYRNQTIQNFTSEVLSLRDPSINARDYTGLEMRPEYYSQSTSKKFVQKFHVFLEKYAKQTSLHTFTAFTLPEGRMPTHSNLWIFKKFVPNADLDLEPEMISITDHRGRKIFDVGLSEESKISTDDPVFYEQNPDLLSRLEKQVFLFPSRQSNLLEKIADEESFLVDHTSCASCHKLNQTMRANFHALSFFLEEFEHTVSQRVRLDVRSAKAWLRNNRD